MLGCGCVLLSGLLTLTLFHCSAESLHVPQERSEVSPGLTVIYKYTNCMREREREREREKIMLYYAFCEEVHSAGPQKHKNRLNVHDKTNCTSER